MIGFRKVLTAIFIVTVYALGTLTPGLYSLYRDDILPSAERLQELAAENCSGEINEEIKSRMAKLFGNSSSADLVITTLSGTSCSFKYNHKNRSELFGYGSMSSKNGNTIISLYQVIDEALVVQSRPSIILFLGSSDAILTF